MGITVDKAVDLGAFVVQAGGTARAHLRGFVLHDAATPAATTTTASQIARTSAGTCCARPRLAESQISVRSNDHLRALFDGAHADTRRRTGSVS